MADSVLAREDAAAGAKLRRESAELRRRIERIQEYTGRLKQLSAEINDYLLGAEAEFLARTRELRDVEDRLAELLRQSRHR